MSRGGKPANVSKKSKARTVLYSTYDEVKKKLTAENKTLKIKFESTQAENMQLRTKLDKVMKDKNALEKQNLTIEEEKGIAYDNLIEALRNTLNVDARTETEILDVVRRLKTTATNEVVVEAGDGIEKPPDLRRVRLLRGSAIITDWRGRTLSLTVGDECEMRKKDLPDQPGEMFEDLGPA